MKAQDLKNSVLQLAIQGKLVEQNPNDEPVSVLLKRIKAEKEQLIEEKKIKKEKTLPEISEEEKLFEIPDSWEWVRFEDAIIYATDYVANGSFASLKANVRTYKEINYAILIKTQDFANNFTRDLTYVDEESYRFLKKSSLYGGELILSNVGSIGKVFIVPQLDIPMSLAPNSIVVKCSNKTITEYIKNLILSFYGQEMLKKFTSGTAIPKFNKTQLRNLAIPLPPLQEQKRIVAKIEEVFEKIEEYDKAEKELTQLEKSFPQELKKSILQYAIQGKLVEQNSNDEPASVLLEKIKAEKEQLIKEKKIKKRKTLPEISEEEKRYELPNGWKWVRIGDVSEINPRNKIDDDLKTSFIPMKLIEDGYSNLHTMETRKWKEIKSGFTHFAEDDVVLAKITPCFQNRKSAIMKNLINGVGAGTTELYVLRPYGKYVLSEFLLYLVKSHDFIEGGVRTYTGTAGQQRVKKEYVENYVFALPPIEEQRRILSELDRAFNTITRLEDRMDSNNAINRVVQAKPIEEDKKELVNN